MWSRDHTQPCPGLQSGPPGRLGQGLSRTRGVDWDHDSDSESWAHWQVSPTAPNQAQAARQASAASVTGSVVAGRASLPQWHYALAGPGPGRGLGHGSGQRPIVVQQSYHSDLQISVWHSCRRGPGVTLALASQPETCLTVRGLRAASDDGAENPVMPSSALNL